MAESSYADIGEYVDQWLVVTDDWFTTRDVWNQYNLSTKGEKDFLLRQLGVREKSSTIERNGKQYRRLDKVHDELNWWDCDPDRYFPLIFPYHLGKLIKLPEHGIWIIAGNPGAGKTTLMYEIIRVNCGSRELNLFSNDMDAQEMHNRLRRVWTNNGDDLPIPPLWKTVRRRDRFEQVIDPDGLNIVDYLKVTDSAFDKVGNQIEALDKTLRTGVVIVGMQMSSGQELARGGSPTMDVPKIYTTLHKLGEWDVVKAGSKPFTARQKAFALGWKRMLKIEKARHWVDDNIDPEGKFWGYNLVSGGFKIEGI